MDGILTAVHWLAAAVYPLALGWAVVSDARRLTIPNWTCVAIAVAFLPAALLGRLDPTTVALHYGIGAGLLLAGMALFARGIVGGGDVKLLAAAGVWIGWPDLGPYLALVAVIGGALALVVLLVRRFKARWPFLRPFGWLADAGGRGQPLPYGVAIGVAAILLFSRNPALPPSWGAVLGG